MNQGGFNNFNSKRQTGRVQNFRSINMNPPMAPQFSSFYGSMNAGGVNPFLINSMRQQQQAFGFPSNQTQATSFPTVGSAQPFYQQQPPPPPAQSQVNMMPIQGGYNQQAYNNYYTNTTSTGTAQPFYRQQDIQMATDLGRSMASQPQFYQQPNPPIPLDLLKSIETYGSEFRLRYPNPPIPINER